MVILFDAGPASWPLLSRLRAALLIVSLRLAAVTGQRARLARLTARWRGRHDRRDLRALLPSLLLQVPAVPGLPSPPSWTGLQPVATVTDLNVAFLYPPKGEPAAVLKVARTPRAAQELRAQRLVLSSLASCPVLAGWDSVLPKVLMHRDDEEHTLTVETFLGNTDLANRLAAEPSRADRALVQALGKIHELHRLTGRIEQVSDDHLRQWVDAPLHQLRESCEALTPSSLPAVAEIGAMLRAALTGTRMLVSWTHGDFTPANILIDDGDRVSGIIDWGGARRCWPAPLDSCLLLMSASCHRDGIELGEVVRRALSDGGLPARERQLLARLPGPRSEEAAPDEIDERALVLLSWLHHVAELWRKCELYRESRVWWAFNGEPVLRAVADMRQTAGRT